ncbi:MAG: DedA family protein [Deltaproteobacteria bacterium]|jgi:membrane protein YqaA with SNARE-associated domain|nr:DedA family protein [Deltaproteobacteria bacterium]MBT6435841.1 DedA family protein [Deltaproteobacteria bacterium]
MLESQLWILFSASFMSATFLPGASEVNIVHLVQEGQFPTTILVGVATAGNTLGGLTNYLVGFFAARGVRLRYFERENLQKSLDKIRRYGALSLLFAWLPIVGDPLCLAAGYLKVNWWHCTICMAIGKLVRYVALILMVAQLR